jgi:histone deacetylase 1/2
MRWRRANQLAQVNPEVLGPADPEKGLILAPGDKLFLHASSDSDWGGDAISLKSTSGGLISLGVRAYIVFYSVLQRKLADSSQMAETYAAHQLVRAVLEVRGKLAEMGVDVPLPISLLQDNRGVVKMSKNPMAHAGSKHFRIPQAFIRGEVEDGVVLMEDVDGDKNPADYLTKQSTPIKFEADCDKVMGAQSTLCADGP